MGNPGARFPYGKYEKDPSSIQISNLPAGMSTLKRSAHYGRSQLKMILEAEEHVVISVGEKRKSEASTTETTGDVVTQNPETESQVNPVENPTSNATNVDTNSTTQPGPSQLTSEIPQTKDDNFHARMQERSLRELKFSYSWRVSQKICNWCVVEKLKIGNMTSSKKVLQLCIQT